MSALLPCPFCGGEAGIAGLEPHLYVRCHCCGCEGPVFQTMPDEAIAAWNRRTPEPGTRVLRDGQPDDFTREQAAKRAEEHERVVSNTASTQACCRNIARAIRAMGEKL